MKTKMKIGLIAVFVLAVLIVAGTAYAKSNKPVLVVICPADSTTIDYELKPGYVELIAFEKCIILKGVKAAKTNGGDNVVPPGDPPKPKNTPFPPADPTKKVDPTVNPKGTPEVVPTEVRPTDRPKGWTPNKSKFCEQNPDHWKCKPPYLPPGQQTMLWIEEM